MSSTLRDLLLGLVSAAITGSLAYAWNRAKLYRQRAVALRQHPIEGYYASSYTDELHGVPRTVRDEVHIEQQGLDFTGVSRNLESGRQFHLRGQIVNERYLTGTYGGEHRADDASGTFFMVLDLLREGRIQGLWAGYGAEAGKVLSGTWRWRKLLGVDFFDCDPSDPVLQAVAPLLNDALGSGFVGVDELRDLCASPHGMVVVAKGPHGELIGAGTALRLDEPATANLEAKLIAAGVRRPNLIGNPVGMLKSAAVVPTVRGQGVGLRLVYERLSRLRDLGCAVALVLAWDSRTAESSIGVLEAAGFKRVVDLPEYWREPVGQETFDCIKCGRPCACTAVVMRRSLYDFVDKDLPHARGHARRLVRR